MDEQQWLASEDPAAMLAFLADKASERKLRLFACACCRRVWTHIEDTRSRRMVELVEQFADGLIGSEMLPKEAVLSETAMGQVVILDDAACFETAARDIRKGAGKAAFYVGRIVAEVAFDAKEEALELDPELDIEDPDTLYHMVDDAGAEAEAAEKQAQAKLLRDLFGNPFDPVAFDPAWISPDVLLLARGIDEERAFDRLAILADALEESGCNEPKILDHCRRPGEHARGCWVVDGLLSWRSS